MELKHQHGLQDGLEVYKLYIKKYKRHFCGVVYFKLNVVFLFFARLS
jgi:hypothetical protein